MRLMMNHKQALDKLTTMFLNLAQHRSERVSKPPKRYGLDNDFGELYLLGDNDTKKYPRDYTEAMSDIDSKR